MKPTKLPSGKWRCQIYLGKDEDGKRIVQYVSSPDYYDCLEKASKIAKHHHDTVIDPSTMTFDEAIDAYIKLKSNVLSPATIRGYKTIQRNHLQPEMQMPIRKISNNIAQRAINREAGTCSAKTVKNIYGLLTAVLSQFTETKLNVTLPQATLYEANILSETELKTLIKALSGEEVEIPILLAMFLGLRRSEILALKHEDYDHKNRILNIHAALVPNENNKYVEKTTKTVKSNRKISVPPKPTQWSTIISRN